MKKKKSPQAQPEASVPTEKKGYGLRSPDSVIDERINQAVDVLRTKPHITRYQLHKLFRDTWRDKTGKPADWRTIDRLVSRARNELLLRLKRSREDFRCDVLSAYEREVANENPSIRLSALSGIRDLLGLDAPRQSAVDLTTAGQALTTKIEISWPHESGEEKD